MRSPNSLCRAWEKRTMHQKASPIRNLDRPRFVLSLPAHRAHWRLSVPREVTMKLRTMVLFPAIGFAVLLCGSSLFGQTAGDAAQAHVMAAKTAAGQEHTALFNALCAAPAPPVPPAPVQPAVTRPGPPARSAWHADPVKVFDNLYFLGMTEYSAWAVNTSDGIIIVD